jgi:hypothetical protein
MDNNKTVNRNMEKLRYRIDFHVLGLRSDSRVYTMQVPMRNHIYEDSCQTFLIFFLFFLTTILFSIYVWDYKIRVQLINSQKSLRF